VRRALLRSMPAITRFYGIRPWEIEQFTMDELNEYLRSMDEYNRQAELNARRQARHGPARRRG
jgi:hypothetical protein